MGQKVKPIGLRVGINRTWDSRWYAGRNYGELLHQDIQLRTYLMDRNESSYEKSYAFDELQLEDVKNKLEKIYNGFQEGDLENVNMNFESGTLSKFWLYADTKALEDLQAMIQVLV